MDNINNILEEIERLPLARGAQWTISSVVPGRIHISRGPTSENALFIEGSRESFGRIPAFSGIEHSSNVLALPEGRRLAALRLVSADPTHGGLKIAHIAHELARCIILDPSIDNRALLASVEWILPLLGSQGEVMSQERQRGVVGECFFLRTLLLKARDLQLHSATVLDRWWGHDHSKRDFAAEGVAIEVKTTSLNVRQHYVGSIQQLDPQGADESVYIYSVGIKTDSSAFKKLPDFIADVDALLVRPDGTPDSDAKLRFATQLRAYGYHAEHVGTYANGPGYLRPHLEPSLYDERDLDRVRLTSFVGSSLPTMVIGVSYLLDIRATPLSPEAADAVIELMLIRPPSSYQ